MIDLAQRDQPPVFHGNWTARAGRRGHGPDLAGSQGRATAVRRAAAGTTPTARRRPAGRSGWPCGCTPGGPPLRTPAHAMRSSLWRGIGWRESTASEPTNGAWRRGIAR